MSVKVREYVSFSGIFVGYVILMVVVNILSAAEKLRGELSI